MMKCKFFNIMTYLGSQSFKGKGPELRRSKVDLNVTANEDANPNRD